MEFLSGLLSKHPTERTSVAARRAEYGPAAPLTLRDGVT